MLESYADRWALVTGASSGLGAEFARRLAARGMYLVLTARRQERLDELARELHTHHGTKTIVIATDLSEPTQPKCLTDTIKERGIEIELLVNNAGFGVVGEIESTDVSRVLEMVRLNISAVTELNYRFLPDMLKRKHGAIINISSAAAFQPVAYMAAYAASKAYILHFSEALTFETRDNGVTVLAVCPGVTRTPFLDVAGVQGWLKKYPSHSPEQVVHASLRALEKRHQYVVPGWRNYLRSLMVRIAPRKTVVNESSRYFRPVPKNKDEKE